MANYTLGKAIVDSAAMIYEAWEDSSVEELEIRPGTYDFNGIATDLIIDDGKSIEFVDQVVFQNVRIRTRTNANNEFDTGAGSATVSWSSPNWVRSAGSWSTTPDSSWWIFVRDTWYNVDTATASTINPVIDYNGPALAGHNYVLCKPTKNVSVRGNLRLECDDSPAGHYCYLYGLVWCDLENWNLHVTRASASSLSGSGIASVIFAVSAMQRTPNIYVSDFSWELSSAGNIYGIYVVFTQHVSGSLRVNHIEMKSDTYNGSTVGIWLELCDYDNFDVNVSGIFRNGASVTGDVIGIWAPVCNYSLFSGMSIAPNSTVGSELAYSDGGSGNLWNLVTRAA